MHSLSIQVNIDNEKTLHNLLDTGLLLSARVGFTDMIVHNKWINMDMLQEQTLQNRSIHSSRTGSIFQSYRIPMVKVLKLYLHWCIDTQVKQTCELTGISSNTVMKVFRLLRLACSQDNEEGGLQVPHWP